MVAPRIGVASAMNQPAAANSAQPRSSASRLLAGEDRQRAQAVRPHPPLGAQGAVGGLQPLLVDPPRAGEVVDDRQPAAGGAGPRRRLADPDDERRHQLGEALGALGEGAAERHGRLGRAHLPHHPLPAHRRRGRGDRDALALGPRLPPRAVVVVAPQRQAVGVAEAGVERWRLGELDPVVGAHAPQRLPHALQRHRPLEGVGEPGLGDDVAGHSGLIYSGARPPASLRVPLSSPFGPPSRGTGSGSSPAGAGAGSPIRGA